MWTCRASRSSSRTSTATTPRPSNRSPATTSAISATRPATSRRCPTCAAIFSGPPFDGPSTPWPEATPQRSSPSNSPGARRRPSTSSPATTPRIPTTGIASSSSTPWTSRTSPTRRWRASSSSSSPRPRSGTRRRATSTKRRSRPSRCRRIFRRGRWASAICPSSSSRPTSPRTQGASRPSTSSSPVSPPERGESECRPPSSSFFEVDFLRNFLLSQFPSSLRTKKSLSLFVFCRLFDKKKPPVCVKE
mmetsp:Transcript_35903/g.115045  ORF Transcript_35903/g.115045 Transcript_35903/m.115045 type:complete len:248 (-) Transcript_35903:347-1090(-)